jgi:hypothetical protein
MKTSASEKEKKEAYVDGLLQRIQIGLLAMIIIHLLIDMS